MTTLDPHIEAIAAARYGRRVLVCHPVKASYGPHGRSTTLKFGAPCIVRKAAPDHVDLEVKSGGGVYLLRVLREGFADLELEPAR